MSAGVARAQDVQGQQNVSNSLIKELNVHSTPSLAGKLFALQKQYDAACADRDVKSSLNIQLLSKVEKLAEVIKDQNDAMGHAQEALRDAEERARRVPVDGEAQRAVWQKERAQLEQMHATLIAETKAERDQLEAKMEAMQMMHMEQLLSLADMAQKEAEKAQEVMMELRADAAVAMEAKEKELARGRLDVAEIKSKLMNVLAATGEELALSKAITDREVAAQAEEMTIFSSQLDTTRVDLESTRADLDAALKELEASLAALSSSRAAVDVEAARAERLNAVMASEKVAHDAEVADLCAAHAAEMDSVKSMLKAEMLAAREQADAINNSQRESFNVQVDALNVYHEQRCESYKAQVEALKAAHDQLLAELKTEQELEVHSLKSTIATMAADHESAISAIEAEYVATIDSMKKTSVKGASEGAALQAEAVEDVAARHDISLANARLALQALDARRASELHELQRAYEDSAREADETAARVVSELESQHADALDSLHAAYRRQMAAQGEEHANTISALKMSFEGVAAANASQLKAVYEAQGASVQARLDDALHTISTTNDQLEGAQAHVNQMQADFRLERESMAAVARRQDDLLTQLRVESAMAIGKLVDHHETAMKESALAFSRRELELESEHETALAELSAHQVEEVIELRSQIAELSALSDRAAADTAGDLTELRVLVSQQVATLSASSSAAIIEAEAAAAAREAVLSAETTMREASLLQAHELSGAVARHAAESACNAAINDRDESVRSIRSHYEGVLVSLKARHDSVVAGLSSAHGLEVAGMRRVLDAVKQELAETQGQLAAKADPTFGREGMQAAVDAVAEAQQQGMRERVARYESLIVELRQQVNESRTMHAASAARAVADTEASTARYDSLLSELTAVREAHALAELSMRASFNDEVAMVSESSVQQGDALKQLKETHERTLAQAMQSLLLNEAKSRSDAAVERAALSEAHAEVLSAIRVDMASLQAALEAKSAEFDALLGLLAEKESALSSAHAEHILHLDAMVDAHRRAVTDVELTAVSREETVEAEADAREAALRANMDAEVAELRGSLAELHSFLDRAAADNHASLEDLQADLMSSLAAMRKVHEGDTQVLETASLLRDAALTAESSARESAVLTAAKASQEGLMETLKRIADNAGQEAAQRERTLRDQYERTLRDLRARQDAAISGLSSAHAAEVVALRSRHGMEIRELQASLTSLQSGVSSVRDQYATASAAAQDASTAEGEQREKSLIDRLASASRDLLELREQLNAARGEAAEAYARETTAKAAYAAQLMSARDAADQRVREGDALAAHKLEVLASELAQSRVSSAEMQAEIAQRHATEIGQIKSEADGLRSALQSNFANHEAALAQITSAHEMSLADARQARLEAVSALKGAHEAAIREREAAEQRSENRLREQHAAELLALKSRAAEEVAQLVAQRATDRAMIAGLQSGSASSTTDRNSKDVSSLPAHDMGAVLSSFRDQHERATSELRTACEAREKRADEAVSQAQFSARSAIASREAELSSSHAMVIADFRNRIKHLEHAVTASKQESSRALASSRESYDSTLSAVRASHEAALASVRAAHDRSLAQALQASIAREGRTAAEAEAARAQAVAVVTGLVPEDALARIKDMYEKASRDAESAALSKQQAEVAAYIARQAETQAANSAMLDDLHAKVASLSSSLADVQAAHAEETASLMAHHGEAIAAMQQLHANSITSNASAFSNAASDQFTAQLAKLDGRFASERRVLQEEHLKEVHALRAALAQAQEDAAELRRHHVVQPAESGTAHEFHARNPDEADADDDVADATSEAGDAALHQAMAQLLTTRLARAEADYASDLEAARAAHTAEASELRGAIARLAAATLRAATPRSHELDDAAAQDGQASVDGILVDLVARLAAAKSESASIRAALQKAHAASLADITSKLEAALKESGQAKAEGMAATRAAVAAERHAASARESSLSHAWRDKVSQLERALADEGAVTAKKLAVSERSRAAEFAALQASLAAQLREQAERLVARENAHVAEISSIQQRHTAEADALQAGYSLRLDELHAHVGMRGAGKTVVEAQLAIAVDAAVSAAVAQNNASFASRIADLEKQHVLAIEAFQAASRVANADVSKPRMDAEVRARVAQEAADSAQRLSTALSAMAAKISAMVRSYATGSDESAALWARASADAVAKDRVAASATASAVNALANAVASRTAASFERQLSLAQANHCDTLVQHASEVAALHAHYAAALQGAREEVARNAVLADGGSHASDVTSSLLTAEVMKLRSELAVCDAKLSSAHASVAASAAVTNSRVAAAEAAASAHADAALAALRDDLAASATGQADSRWSQRGALLQSEADRFRIVAAEAKSALSAVRSELEDVRAAHASLIMELAVTKEQHAVVLATLDADSQRRVSAEVARADASMTLIRTHQQVEGKRVAEAQKEALVRAAQAEAKVTSSFREKLEAEALLKVSQEAFDGASYDMAARVQLAVADRMEMEHKLKGALEDKLALEEEIREFHASRSAAAASPAPVRRDRAADQVAAATIATLQEEKARLEEKISEERSRLEAEVSTVTAQLHALRSRVDELETSAKEAASTIAALELAAEAAQKRLAEAALTGEVEAAQAAEVGRLQAENNALRLQSASVAAAVTVKDAEAKQLQSALLVSRAALQDSRQVISALQAARLASSQASDANAAGAMGAPVSRSEEGVRPEAEEPSVTANEPRLGGGSASGAAAAAIVANDEARTPGMAAAVAEAAGKASRNGRKGKRK